ncbi:Transposon Ty3-I Gag-Pol polyprotein [Vitis vinifera]|uniref:Transposon Ty3-I Gag-Pol polyprotein n=1 Tax=Vitis vinifera TaxID=29760 RepID=A0A438KFB8_VITVI|nr:Transposon Ty3-I Gag-Pol polyprotein [Vitis vinifera]
MDAVLHIFKRSICPGTPFFESLAKKPPTTMDDLFRRANKYSMLEDDVRAATQQVLVTGRASRDDADRHAKPPDRPKPVDRRRTGRVVRIGRPSHPYPCRGKGRNCCEAASIRERINSIRPGLTGEGPRPIDGTIIFPPVDPTRTLQPHRDALILSLEIGDFDVRRILVDPGSSADLVQASVVGHMGHSLAGLENPGRILSGIQRVINYILRRHYTAGPSWPSHSQRAILGGTRVSPFNVILGRTWLHYMKAIPSTYHQMPDPFDRRLDAFIRIDKKLSETKLTNCWKPDSSEKYLIQMVGKCSGVPKKEGEWQVCVDYTNLNNACPKDSFSITTNRSNCGFHSGQGVLSFLDAFSGYHQIPMSPDDEEKTAFITPHGLYCYKVMPSDSKMLAPLIRD